MTETATREELWVSFRSLLRSYLSAASIGVDVPQVLLHDLEPNRCQIVTPRHTICLEFEPATGEGYWSISGQPETDSGILDEGAFRLHLDAQMEGTGKPGLLEMDQVAEALAMLALT